MIKSGKEDFCDILLNKHIKGFNIYQDLRKFDHFVPNNKQGFDS